MDELMVEAASRCERCGREAPADARFCAGCGAPLAAAAPRREERKLVSILFVDLEGFTASADEADPEDVRDALARFHDVAREQVEAYGGVLEKFIGDAVMAVFGAPVARGDDAERAVRAGLRVLEAVAELSEMGFRLGARAAVNTGEAVVAVDRADAGEPLAIGDVVNTAARLQASAPVGRLVVGRETRRATRHAIGYEPLPAVVAKGKAAPVEAWGATEVLVGPAERPGLGARFVGRRRELDVIRSVWRQATEDRHPHVVTLLGPSGIGKSRLCREFEREIGRAGREPCAVGACPTRSRPATTRPRSSFARRSGSSTRIRRTSPAASSKRASRCSSRRRRPPTPRGTSLWCSAWGRPRRSSASGCCSSPFGGCSSASAACSPPSSSSRTSTGRRRASST